MWKTLDELEKYLYMSQDETLRRVGQSLVTLVEQEIEARVDDRINEACEEARDEGYRDGLLENKKNNKYKKKYEAGKKDALKRPVIG